VRNKLRFEKVSVRCLVTGATGFIGLHLVPFLTTAGHEVTCLVRRSSQVDALRAGDVRLVEGDVDTGAGLDAAIAGQDAVVHLAGSIRGIRRHDFFRTNAEGVKHVVAAAARSATPPTTVLASSIAVAGPVSPEQPHRPEDACQPVSYYGESKLAGEAEARRFAADVPISIVRCPIVFGEGDRVSFEWFRSLAKFRTHFVPGFRAHRYSLVHVADVVRSLVAIVERGRRVAPGGDSTAPGRGVYYVAADETPTYAEIGNYLAAALGIAEFRTISTPVAALRLAAFVGECLGRVTGKAPFLNVGKVREASAGSWVCCTRSARDDFDFAAAAPLADRFAATADWYRRQGWL
jgi:nucleoside-diphosphate-sugar epimerase